MKHAKSFAILFSAWAALVNLANAQQPPDVVASDGCSNTAMGTNALFLNSNGTSCSTSGHNTATGYSALYNNSTGAGNTATGNYALSSNTTGNNNTAIGFDSLGSNQDGYQNTAAGEYALSANISGYQNTAVGDLALTTNVFGFFNTATGFQALLNNDGDYNTATGVNALYTNTGGASNTAMGVNALYANDGNHNSAFGTDALQANTTGNNNTASGYLALSASKSGSGNVAIGFNAGSNITLSNNVDIANAGGAADSGTIRIGGTNQKTVFVAGIVNTQITGSPVYVTANGKLGVLASSERYKTSIKPMGNNTEKLLRLRPVTFHLKTEPNGAVQYGLIAEEVDKVYPELVIRDDKGKIQGVRYDELAPMLLNEVQQLKQQIAELKQLVSNERVAMR